MRLRPCLPADRRGYRFDSFGGGRRIWCLSNDARKIGLESPKRRSGEEGGGADFQPISEKSNLGPANERPGVTSVELACCFFCPLIRKIRK